MLRERCSKTSNNCLPQPYTAEKASREGSCPVGIQNLLVLPLPKILESVRIKLEYIPGNKQQMKLR
jgi:hypothetical protein